MDENRHVSRQTRRNGVLFSNVCRNATKGLFHFSLLGIAYWSALRVNHCALIARTIGVHWRQIRIQRPVKLVLSPPSVPDTLQSHSTLHPVISVYLCLFVRIY